MSNYQAIATVTAALRQALQTLVSTAVPGATVTAVQPDVTGASSELPKPGVNLFLFQVTPNAALRNADAPTRRADGSIVKRPAAAVDLHYLISFYGEDANYETQRLLGAVVTTLHTNPSLSRAQITAGIGSNTNLTGSDLADAVDLVRFTPTGLSLEELSKLWSVMLQIPYVLSTAYQAGPVLLADEDEVVTAAAPPVMLTPRVHAFSQLPPTIEQVIGSAGAGQPITSASTLTLVGTFFPGVAATVLIDGAALSQTFVPTPLPAQPPLLQISGIPLTTVPSSGAHTIQVSTELPGTSPGGSATSLPVAEQLAAGITFLGAHPVVSSTASFVLQPTLSSSSVDPTTRVITATVTPAVSAYQQVRLLLYPFQAAATSANTYVLQPSASASSSSSSGSSSSSNSGSPAQGPTSFTFATTGQPVSVASGTYLVRIQIDGVDSPLQFGPPSIPGGGRSSFTGPTVVLP
jgi:hypothetical protein